MSIHVDSRRKSDASLQKLHPNARILDLTSKGNLPGQKFSPFYPHGNIPVPFSPNLTAQSVEGIWQGLKVFESADVDSSKFTITNMKNLKRTVRSFGLPRGHRKGVDGETLLGYRDARYQIYLPAYKWILDNCLQAEISQLLEIAAKQSLVLLDYETNTDIDNLSKPLSHAGLVKRYLENDWPTF